MSVTRIVILGGGFAGTQVALRLEQLSRRRSDIEITLIDSENFFTFTPLLPEVPSGSIQPKHIVFPLRALLRRTCVRQAEVKSIDLARKVIVAAHCHRCGNDVVPFDHLVLAMGSVPSFFGLPGVAEHALTMKSLSDATALHAHVIDKLEHADMQPSAEARRSMLTFVVAGGGFAGVETLAELNDFVRGARRFYPRIDPAEIRMVLIHSGQRILPEVSESLSAYALKKLRSRGVEVLLQTRVQGCENGVVHVARSGGFNPHGGRSQGVVGAETRTGTAPGVETPATVPDVIPASTFVWAAGTAAHPLIEKLDAPKAKNGRVVVDATMAVRDRPTLWGIGDSASIPDVVTGGSCPPTAQYALRQGKRLAENIAATIDGKPTKPFRFKALGLLAGLGRRTAVAEIFGFKFIGFFAWWLWRTIYLMKLPGLERKVRVAIDWTLDLFFPRDIVYLRPLHNRHGQNPVIGHDLDEGATCPLPAPAETLLVSK